MSYIMLSLKRKKTHKKNPRTQSDPHPAQIRVIKAFNRQLLLVNSLKKYSILSHQQKVGEEFTNALIPL